MTQSATPEDWIVGLHDHYWMNFPVAAVNPAQFCTQSTRKEKPWVMPITAASTSKPHISFSIMPSDSSGSQGLHAALAELRAAHLTAGESRGDGTGSHEGIEPRIGLRWSRTTFVAASTNP